MATATETTTEAPYRELLAVIRDALDLPRPADGVSYDKHDRLMVRRAEIVASDLRVTLESIGDADRIRSEQQVVADSTSWIREQLAKHPVTYETRQPT